MTVLSALTALFVFILIVCGGVYITTVEKAPLWERIQVFGVGFGMYCGIIGIYWGL